MKIYFDACCLCRPFDDLSQARIHFEADAVLAFKGMCDTVGWTFAASSVLNAELSRISDTQKFADVMGIYKDASEYLRITDAVKQRAQVFQERNMKTFDSFHLALAEVNGYDVLLTTDDDFLRVAQKIQINIPVKNPINWLAEVLKNESSTNS
jgi:predicted nucleic acid-binding protein